MESWEIGTVVKKIKPLLQGKNISVGYRTESGTNILLENIDFSIFPEEVICIMGRNGCGKTTLLRAIAGLSNHLSGEIFIKRKKLSEISRTELATLISVVLTDKVEVGNLTVHEVIALGRFPYTNFWGKLTKNDRKIIDDVITLMNLEDIQNHFFSMLSDGQKQKVLIARAIAQDTPILLLDEPTTFLDIPGKLEILKLLKKIAAQKKIAVLFTSHDWELVLEMANRIWPIDESGKMKHGMPEDMILNGEFEKCFRHENFDFNQDHGSFHIRQTDFMPVLLEGGDKTHLYWTTHALKKEGYADVQGNESKSKNIPSIFIANNVWTLKFKEKKHECNSIDYLIKWLKFLYPVKQ